jgi:hypothetical protein
VTLAVVIVFHHNVFLSEYNDIAGDIGECIYTPQVLLTTYDMLSLVFTVIDAVVRGVTVALLTLVARTIFESNPTPEVEPRLE